MICPKCAMEINESSKFCSECGVVLKDFGKENNTGNITEETVVAEEYDYDEGFFRVEKNGGEKAPKPYDVVPKPSRKPVAIPPPTPSQPSPSAPQEHHIPVQPTSGAQVYTAPPIAPTTTILPSQPPATPKFEQGTLADSGKKKKQPSKITMLLLGGVVTLLAVVVVFLGINLKKGNQVVKMDRHDGFSSTVEQSASASKDNQQSEDNRETSTARETSVVESSEIDPAEEALKAKAVKEALLIADKEKIRKTMSLYYISFLDSINLENSDVLVYSTDANKEIVDYKIENPNKGYLFIPYGITYDLDSIEVVEDETTGEKTATLNAKFDFIYRKKTETDDDLVSSENLQKCSFIYDSDTENWLVDNTEIDSTIVIGDNIEAEILLEIGDNDELYIVTPEL